MPMLIWLIINLVHRNWRVVVRSGLIMLGGFMILTLPVLIYFGVNGAFDNLWEVYFKVNLFNYNGDIEGLTQSEKIANHFKGLLRSFFTGAYFIIVFLWGLDCSVIDMVFDWVFCGLSVLLHSFVRVCYYWRYLYG